VGVTVGQWYVSRGRIPRRVYWLHYVLPIAAASVLASLIDTTLGLWVLEPSARESGLGVLGSVVGLAAVVPSVSSYVTRLHDRGHSAWFMLWIFLPIVGAIMLFIQTGFLRGEDVPNQYGPPTTRPVNDPAFV
jgi:uncharacterized membrane protein YhaH (DUF805 family)